MQGCTYVLSSGQCPHKNPSSETLLENLKKWAGGGGGSGKEGKGDCTSVQTGL